MVYEKPEMDVVLFERNVYMALSLQPGGNEEGEGEGINPYGVF